MENQAKEPSASSCASYGIIFLINFIGKYFLSNKPHLLKYTVQWGLTVISSYKTTSKMQNISITSAKGVLCLCEVHSSLHLWPQASTTLLFYHCRLVRILHKWGHTMPTSFVCLASFIKHRDSQIPSCHCAYQ